MSKPDIKNMTQYQHSQFADSILCLEKALAFIKDMDIKSANDFAQEAAIRIKALLDDMSPA